MTKEELLKTAKPILFNTEMVQAILNGLKTTTRRYVKAKSKNACGFYVTFRESDGSFTGVYDYDENGKMFESPQTQPAYKGDILYVRESWSWCPCWDCGMETDDGKCADPNGHRRYNSEKRSMDAIISKHLLMLENSLQVLNIGNPQYICRKKKPEYSCG